MMVHRLLSDLLAGFPPANRGALEERCVHSSEMEKLAADAERASIKYKQVEYMAQFIGQQFEGIISGVKDFGFYVEIDSNKCEGMVRLNDLTDGYYDYIEEEFSLVGGRPRRRLTVGDTVTIQVVKADLENKFLDFHLVAHQGKPIESREGRYGENPRDSRPRGRKGAGDSSRRGGARDARGSFAKRDGGRREAGRGGARYGQGASASERGTGRPTGEKQHGRLASRRRRG